ncbi:response regulator [bacterium]|nr:response regulator [bacterium]NIN92225.1 response regulator [bacterium]NIO18367.1 response regulator [bacterium]NIO73346.1 response regulator [bacterium]
MKKTNILIVDDEIDLLETLGDIFESKGYNVTMVEDGNKALELLRNKYFDIILMDLKMPGISGVESFKEVKSLHPSAAIIMMTAGSVREEIKEAVGAGVDAVVDKPFNVKKLVATIESILERPLILVVDDRVEDRETLRDILVDRNYRAFIAKDGYEAIDIVRKSDFDVILLDIRMPGMDGMEVLEVVKEIKPDIGVVMMTGYSSEGLAGKSLKKGAYTCLYKPFLDMEKLLRVIDEVQEKRKRVYSSWQKVRVLLVDEEAAHKEAISNILTGEGYRIIPANNGQEALKRVEESFCNVALIDSELSDMSGPELAKKLKEMSKKTCVIMISRFSALDLETLEDSAKEAIFDYLIEPIDPAQLKKLIKEGLKEQKKW